MEKLSEKMLERLQKWRDKIAVLANGEKVPGKAQRNYVARKTYGDEEENINPNQVKK